VFAIPYEHDFTLIGTTDIEYHGEPAGVRIERAEVDYLCAIVNRYFREQIGAADVLWSYAGVRPLIEDESADPAAVTRDYALEIDGAAAPLLSVFGGKITTYRRLAAQAVDLLAARLAAAPRRGPTGRSCPEEICRRQLRCVSARRGAALRVAAATAARTLCSAYGTAIHRLLGTAAALADLGPEIFPGLYEREAEYLCREEWAVTSADILWRRTKLGLHAPPERTQRLDDWLARR